MSRTLRTILVGVDGSPGGARALDWAAARSLDTGAEVLAVHVLTYSQQLGRDLSPSGLTNWRRKLQSDLAGPWTEQARASGAQMRTALVEDESPAAGLLAAAGDEQADLIVVGAHGRGNLADRLLGATTYIVAHRAQSPVVIIPPDWTPAPAA